MRGIGFLNRTLRALLPGVLGACLAAMSPGAPAAPLLTAAPPFQTWNAERAPLEIVLSSREDIGTLDILVIDLDGDVVLRRTRFEVSAGEEAFEWDGRLADDSIVRPGRYRVRFAAEFRSGNREIEEAEVRVLEPGEAASGAETFAPPVVPYEAPSHVLGGELRYYHRDDRERGRIVNEKSVRVRYRDRGEQFRFDGVFDFLRRTGPVETFDNTRAAWRYEWPGGEVSAVFRRSLGDFDDPLRLYADFRTETDKRGIRATHAIGPGRLSVLHVDGRPSAGGRQSAWAARWSGRIGPSITYGAAFTSDDRDTGPRANVDANAAALDLAWTISRAHRVLVGFALSDTDSSDAAIESGDGAGRRITWEYTGVPGMRLRLGHLDLSSRYNASLSDPGNQIVRNAEGPEASVDYALPVVTSWLEGLRVAANAFAYGAHAGVEDVDQLDLSVQGRLFGRHRVSANVRTRNEAGRRSTSFVFVDRHRWNDRWSGSVQYSRAKSPGSATDRVLLGAATGSGRRYRRLGVELLHRYGASVSNGPVIEIGVLGSGRAGAWIYEVVARRTATKVGGGVNAFARFAYELEALHRYVGQIYLALGDRAAVKLANRVEIGASLRF